MDALRGIIQPLTANLPAPVRDAAVSLLGAECYQTLVLDVDPSATGCLKLAASKGLGIGIIGASAVVKVPQLLKVLSSRSADGISFTSYALETAAYLVGLAYNVRQGFPVSTYGETALIAAQNVAIAAAVLHFRGADTGAAAYVALLAASVYALFQESLVDAPTLAWLQAGAGLLGVASKAPQIWTIWRAGGTGQLSAFAVFNFLLGSAARVFTTLQEVDDPLILYGFVAGFALNAVLAGQMVYYWNAPAAGKAGAAKGEGKQHERVSVPAATPSKGKAPSTRRRG
ncbi:MAG: hypothetical protein M1832_000845 [Thelocarpon impressellum]|nr:MAG: hypothetical protein M1832_000845 [Thelocarpon impressellum]